MRFGVALLTASVCSPPGSSTRAVRLDGSTALA
jgi:hypothetical protein